MAKEGDEIVISGLLRLFGKNICKFSRTISVLFIILYIFLKIFMDTFIFSKKYVRKTIGWRGRLDDWMVNGSNPAYSAKTMYRVGKS